MTARFAATAFLTTGIRGTTAPTAVQKCTEVLIEGDGPVYEGRLESVTVDNMRAALKKRTKYKNSWKWINRVNAMHDAQVIAVYMRMLRAGEILE